MSTPEPGDTITEEITINASAHKVFVALTDPQERVKWWGRAGRFQAQEMQSDLRPGGRWQMTGIGMGGRPFIVEGIYRQIQPPHVLAFTWRPSWQGNAQETLVRFDLSEENGVTKVRLTHSGLGGEAVRGHQGWPDVLSWLKDHAERKD